MYIVNHKEIKSTFMKKLTIFGTAVCLAFAVNTAMAQNNPSPNNTNPVPNTTTIDRNPTNTNYSNPNTPNPSTNNTSIGSDVTPLPDQQKGSSMNSGGNSQSVDKKSTTKSNGKKTTTKSKTSATKKETM